MSDAPSEFVMIDGRKIHRQAQLDELDRTDAEEDLHFFLRKAWRYIDPAPFIDGWVIDALCEHLEAVVDGTIKRLLINIPPRMAKSSIISVALGPWVWAQTSISATSGPQVPILFASYAHTLARRDSIKRRRVIRSSWYQRMFGDRFQISDDQDTKERFSNTRGGEMLITSVDSGITGEGGNIVVVDDPNNAREILSESVAQSTNEDWWDGAMPTRLNDASNGAIIVVQQRLGENDLSGHILDNDKRGDWDHLVLPMHFEEARRATTSIGWTDPRQEEGELLFPERFSESAVQEIATRLGKWRCNSGEAPILMADLSMKRIDQIKIGDEIIGFSRKKRSDTYGRYHLTRTKVTEVHSHVAPVVKMSLDSGEIIRCTRDHKWFMKDKGPGRPKYLPVTLGRSSLARVCPPRLPKLSPDDERLAGWLSGFFDGEGSVSLSHDKREGEYPPGAVISFYQGAGRNLPLCEKLERALPYFGFEWSYSEDERKPNKNALCYGYRNYRLRKNDGVAMLQRFLHIVQPTKWKDRIESAALRANFIQRREKVVSIEPDGEEVVYGLTTTTGNYVAWGLASSNSAGQHEQRPEPKGGGIIQREWWQLWPPNGEVIGNDGKPTKPLEFPPMSYILGSLDTAFTENTMNDPSAMTVWGVFSQASEINLPTRVIRRETQGGSVIQVYGSEADVAELTRPRAIPKVMLLYAWSGYYELHKLLKKVDDTCKAFQVDCLMIENKSRGHDVGVELRRTLQDGKYSIYMNEVPGGLDKVARLYSVQHLFEEKMVFAPERPWAEAVISQCGTFPNAKHDDLVDTTSQALRRLRQIGLLSRPPELQAAASESIKHVSRRSRRPLYPGSRA